MTRDFRVISKQWISRGTLLRFTTCQTKLLFPYR